MYELNKTEFDVLSAVFDGLTTNREIAKNLDRSQTRISVVVQGLCEKGFLKTKRTGMAYVIGFSDHLFIQFFKALIQDQFPLHTCLADTRMTMLSLFLGPRKRLSKSEITFKTGFSDVTVRKFVSSEIKYGVLKKIPYGYKLSRSAIKPRNFLEEYSIYTSSRLVNESSNNAVMLWRQGFEFIYSIPKSCSPTVGYETGVTAFKKGGVEILGDRNYFHNTLGRSKLSHEDFILDNIILNDFNRTSILYSAIYLKKNLEMIDERRLITLSSIYGQTGLANNLLSFINLKRKDIEGFPKYNEFEEKYRIYEEG